MNILVLNNTSDLYGGSKILYTVVKILAESDHTPIVVVSEDGPLVDALRKLNVEVQFIRLGILRRKYLSIPGILNRIFVTKKAWQALNKLVDDRKIDLIYSNTTSVFIGALLAKKRKIKHIWHVQEIITKPLAFSKAIGHLLGKYNDETIVVSEAVKEHWQKYVFGGHMTKIYSSIDTTEYHHTTGTLRKELGFSDNDLVITMIGRVNHWKGQGYFVDIAKEILKSHPDTKFVMAGDAYPGNEHLVDQLVEKLKKENLTNAIRYIGYRTDIANLLSSSDIFVLPSTLPDPFPTVILEAMASARAVIATNHGGATEMVVNQHTGLHIPFDNVHTAAAIISPLLNDRAKIKSMGQNGRDRVNQLYSLTSFKEAILKTFKQTFES